LDSPDSIIAPAPKGAGTLAGGERKRTLEYCNRRNAPTAAAGARGVPATLPGCVSFVPFLPRGFASLTPG